MNPAALTLSQPFAPPAISTKVNGVSTPVNLKPTKVANPAQRVDLEPLYTSLKAAIGDHWAEYKEAISLFVLGGLNQNEFSLRTDYFLAVDPSTEHLHNQLVAAIFANVPRDLPDVGVAPWVSANDKPTVLSKPVSGDAAEQRLKTEVMQLPARDRRRLKEIPDNDQTDPTIASISQYYLAKQFKTSDVVPASAGGFNKTNWELEIRKRYAQPLASETGEFPDADAIQGRMVPICYEESLVNGCAPTCAPFLATATEYFIKEILSSVYSRTRSNMRGGSVNSILTHRFKRQLQSEEDAVTRGELLVPLGARLLPVEVKESASRKPLGMHDLKLALTIGDVGLGQFRHISAKVKNGYQEGELEEYLEHHRVWKHSDVNMLILENGNRKANGVNGIVATNGVHEEDPAIEDDDDDCGWDGGGSSDRLELNMLLDQCMSAAE